MPDQVSGHPNWVKGPMISHTACPLSKMALPQQSLMQVATYSGGITAIKGN